MSDQLNNALTFQTTLQDKLGASWSRMVDCISHDLTSPLMSMSMGMDLLAEMLPSLLKAYHVALEHQLIPAEISAKRLACVEHELIADSKRQIQEILEFFKLLSTYNSQLFSDASHITLMPASACINQLLTTYAFKNPLESGLVEVDCDYDFNFKCAPIFIESVLQNLLTNALRSIDWANKGTIRIWTEQTEPYNTLHIKDTGLGMDDGAKADVFKRFFSKQDQKIIPGLGFCRLALLQSGGDIICQASKGEYTHFLINFPKI